MGQSSNLNRRCGGCVVNSEMGLWNECREDSVGMRNEKNRGDCIEQLWETSPLPV